MPALWPWGVHLLMSLLSLGSGLDTLEGESPAFQPFQPFQLPPHPQQLYSFVWVFIFQDRVCLCSLATTYSKLDL